MEKNKNREFCSPADPEKMFSNIQCLVFVVHFTVLSDRCFIVHFMYMDSRRTIGKWSAAFRQNMKDHRTSEFLWFIFELFLFVFPGIYQVVMKTVFVLESWWRRFEPNLKFSFSINTKKNIFIAMRPGFRTRVYFNSRNSTGENCHIEFA